MGHSDQWQLVEMGFIDSLPDGVAFVDSDLRVQWTNRPFLSILGHADSPVGRTLTELLTSPEFPEIDLSPLTSEDPGQPQHRLILRVDSRKWLGLRSRPCSARTPGRAQESASGSQVDANSEVIDGYAVTVRDVSLEVMERQKQEAIYRAGLELGNLSPDEVTSMSHDERVDLLKESILEFTQDILGYKTFEIRQLNPFTQELLPLLEFGMNPEAAARRLFARPEENGVTGYVAYTGTPYLCNDTLVDPRYLCGINDAHSSLTVPLMLRDIVLGTFNVESPGTRAFDEQDLEFLLLFGRIVANELNQLQLLVAEKVTTETQNSDRLRREISDPSDIILRDATWILERYIGHDPDVCDRLHRIVEATRKISGRIDHVDEGGPSTSMVGSVIAREPRPKLRRKRILVIDGDIVARDDAHTLLGQMGCFVEAVPNCEDACLMARSHHYDVILTDIRLPDKNGYECFRQLRDINANVPIIMMTGFGYDPTHSIVNARKEGLKSVLYKPFRRGQLLDEVEKAVSTPPPHDS
ncbi:MAG: response regulator [Planctomycetaceae bacterium]